MDQIKEYLNRIDGRLIAALGALLVGCFIIWWTARSSLDQFADDVTERITVLHQSAELGTGLTATVLEQVATGEHYLVQGDEATAEEFVQLGMEAHEALAAYGDLPGLSSRQQVQIAEIGDLHAMLEVEYSLAHALSELGRPEEAAARVDAVQPETSRLQDLIRVLSADQASEVALTALAVEDEARAQQRLMLVVLLLTTAVGVLLIVATIRAINRPLNRLVVAAGRLGQGDLNVQVDGRMPTELDVLRGAFASMTERLRTIVRETIATSEQIGSSSSDLSTIAHEVAASSGQVSTAMEEISTGADQQVSGLETMGTALTSIQGRTSDVNQTSQRLRELSDSIRELASSRRDEIGKSIDVLLEVREVVHTSGEEVNELQKSSRRINDFVEAIQGIAQQTNLLALNAAIEAARAGEHGQGFAVVADEVRKLADRSAAAADEVAESVSQIHHQIEDVVAVMQSGTEKVGGVEEVSKSAESAFEEIISAVDEVAGAAERVASIAADNRDAVASLEATMAAVSTTAESHAAGAEQVTAASQEQSAATEEMSAASTELLQAAERLRELVSGFNV